VASLRMDRTAEFRQIIASRHAHQHQRVTGSSGPPRAPAKRSEFAVAALQVGADIHTTAGKLAKLTKLVQSKSLFEDPTIEINQLTDIIKSDINALKGRHGALQGALAHAGSAKQRAMHSKGVVDSLESRLIEAATEFDRVLHTRARNIEHMHTAQDQFTGTFAPPAPIFEMIAPPPAPPSSSFGGGSGAGGAAIGAIGSSTPGAALAGPSTDPTRLAEDDGPMWATPGAKPIGLRRRNAEGSGAAGDHGQVVIDMDDSHGSGQQAQIAQMREVGGMYYDARAQAVETIQSAMADIGSMFQQLGVVVAEHETLLRRIDENVHTSVGNVQAGHDALNQYWRRLRSNRGLMWKIFAILFFFIVVWGTLFA